MTPAFATVPKLPTEFKDLTWSYREKTTTKEHVLSRAVYMSRDNPANQANLFD